MNKITPDILRQSDWFFGDIPEHWRAIPLKHLCKRVSVYGANISSKEYQPEGVRFIRTSDIRDDGRLKKEGVFLPLQKVSDYILSEGDFLISRSGTIGRAYVHRSEHGTCAYAGYLVRYVFRDSQTASWLYYLTKSPNFQQWLGASAIEATIDNVNGEKYANLLVPVPPLSQQHIITDYLDREATRLDDLMSVKERLLELLAEKRRALITRAITRGLDPDVTLRDSGIPWIGEIPIHWNIEKLKYLATLKSGETITSESITETGDYPVFGGNGLRGFASSFTHEGHYVLIGRQGALCGNVHIVSGRFWASEHAIVVSMKKEDEVFWLGELLRAMNLNQYSESAAQPGLAVDFIANLQLPVPSLIDQRSISTHIKTKMVKMDKLKEITKRTIVMLKERRAALIADAVTGKIKVV